MLALRISFTIIIHLIWSTFQAPTDINLAGVRLDSSGDLEVTPNQSFAIRVLGNNIPRGGDFYFTTATTCEDAYLPNNDKISTVPVVSLHSACSFAVLEVRDGLPFNVSSSTYHLCYKGFNAYTEEFLNIKSTDPTTQKFGLDSVIVCCFCILMSAYAAGMTLGYMKFSIVELNNLIKQVDASLAKKARRILVVRRQSNYLVTSFSLFSSIFTVLFTTNVEKLLNGAPNEAVLKIVVPALISLIFAEVIPQAICNSKFGFDLASGLWFVSYFIFVVTFPIAYPVSRVLGRFLKRDVREVLTEEEKTCMIQNMAKNANEKVKTILENATTFANKKVGELMVPIDEVFMLSRSQKLNRSTILTLVEKGYTRIPVYHDKNKNTIVGLLNMKDLRLVAGDLGREPTVREVLLQLETLKEKNKKAKFVAKYVNVEMNAQLLLNQMRTGDFHFACVVKYTSYESKVIGIITIEDILEELFGKIDENNQRRVRSSVDDRADNAVIGWCREAGTDKNYPLSFSQQLRVLQYLLEECQVLKSLEIGYLKCRQILAVERIRIAKKDEVLSVEKVLLVIWKGKVSVTNDSGSFDQEIKVPSAKSTSKDQDEKTVKPNVPVLIAGKEIMNSLMIRLGSPFREIINETEYTRKIVALSEVHYFKVLRIEDLLNAINGSVQAKKTDFVQPADSLIQRLNSRQTTSTHTPKTRTPPRTGQQM
ncbi:hypothetical protein CRE_29449 [Caenorhabditis remanei]|uniref:Metal transporter n=1 Tax=Caenorhabditis remanei TaxID=31234 RepID=E3LV21_CAERE|nr:hypothetical protein CRE_29449 [Caenorhabditis remanei]